MKELKDVLEEIKEVNKDAPEMAGKIHIEAYSNGEKKQETDEECDGFVVMAFKGERVAIHMHGCCIAQMAAAIDGSKELADAAQLVSNRRAGEKLKGLLRGILDDKEEAEEDAEE